jgi:hypothetical protein
MLQVAQTLGRASESRPTAAFGSVSRLRASVLRVLAGVRFLQLGKFGKLRSAADLEVRRIAWSRKLRHQVKNAEFCQPSWYSACLVDKMRLAQATDIDNQLKHAHRITDSVLSGEGSCFIVFISKGSVQLGPRDGLRDRLIPLSQSSVSVLCTAYDDLCPLRPSYRACVLRPRESVLEGLECLAGS